jgi:chorismate dehydratase
MSSNTYTISVVNYYNTTPFLYGLKNSEILKRINLELDIPSICAQKLKNKQVDIGLVPVAVLPELENYHIISDFCIGANGAVDSVKLFAHQPLEKLTHVLLDYQSKTSVTLVQILNKHFWKKNLQFIAATEGFENKIQETTGAVIIGDRTFGLTKENYPYQYDLALEWQKHTGLPFVFACWVSNKKIDDSFIKEFNEALCHGVNHIAEAVAEKPNKTKGFDDYDYLKNKISYPLSADKKQALEKFLEFMEV